MVMPTVRYLAILMFVDRNSAIIFVMMVFIHADLRGIVCGIVKCPC